MSGPRVVEIQLSVVTDTPHELIAAVASALDVAAIGGAEIELCDVQIDGVGTVLGRPS